MTSTSNSLGGVLIVFLLIFWGFLAMFSLYFDVSLSKSSIADLTTNSEDSSTETSIISQAMGFLEDIPVIKAFVPLIKIMTFQYTYVSPYVSIVTDVLAIMSLLAVFLLIRP